MSDEDLFKFLTDVDTTKPLNLDITIQGEWHILAPAPWYLRLWWRICEYVNPR